MEIEVERTGDCSPQTVLHVQPFLEWGKEQINTVFKSPFILIFYLHFFHAMMYCRS
jgi:hypothetical protein